MKKVPFVTPTTVDDAVAALAEEPGARPIAGGTDLWVQLEKKVREPPPLLVSLHRIDELRRLKRDGELLRIGAAVTLARLIDAPEVLADAPLIARAAASMASPAVRTRGTIGGNLCNASPAADLAPPLLVHEAEVTLRGPKGQRQMKLSSFLEGPGQTALAPGELLVEVVVPPLPRGAALGHGKHQVGVCGNLSIVSMALALVFDSDEKCADARVAFGAVAPTAARYPEVERRLVGHVLDDQRIRDAGRLAGSTCSPIDDVRASCDHRCHLVEVLFPRVVAGALADNAREARI